jgi:hypothetical protein
MKSLIVASMMALMMASAQAQVGSTGISPTTNGVMQIGKHAEERQQGGNSDQKARATSDKAYNATLKNLPDKQYDPWHGVR